VFIKITNTALIMLILVVLSSCTINECDCPVAVEDQPQVIYVPEDYETLQAAINAAEEGDTIRVGPGTYNEGLNFFGKNVWFESTDGPEVTIIDATGWTYGIYLSLGEDTTLVIRGFTIEKAIYNGINASDASFSMYNCIIRNNAEYGIACNLGSHAIIENCVTDNNGTNIGIAYSWGRLINTISVNANRYGIWNIAIYPSALNYGYNIYYNNETNFNDPPLHAETDLLQNPLFVNGTYRLDEDSPCIDTGHPQIIDIDETRSDIGVYGGPYAYQMQ